MDEWTVSTDEALTFFERLDRMKPRFREAFDLFDELDAVRYGDSRMRMSYRGWQAEGGWFALMGVGADGERRDHFIAVHAFFDDWLEWRERMRIRIEEAKEAKNGSA